MKVEPGHIAGAGAVGAEAAKLGAAFLATPQVSFAGTSLLAAASDGLGQDCVSRVEGWAAAAAAHVEEDVDGAAILATERARLGEEGRVPQGRKTDGTADGGS